MVQSSNVYQVIQEQIARLRLAEQRFQQERLILERTLTDLRALDEAKAPLEAIPITLTKATVGTQVSIQRKRTEKGHNRPVIVSILRDAGKPLRPSEIGQKAFETGLISSKQGRSGVMSIVGTVLARNQKETFVHLDSGLWDLRERHPQPANNGQVRPSIVAVSALELIRRGLDQEKKP